MESNQQKVDTILDQIEKLATTQQLDQALAILHKLIANIISNPMEPKFRHLKTSNNTIKNKVMSLPNIEELLRQLGYERENEEIYTLKDQQIGDFLEGAPAIEYRKRLTAAKLESPQAYEKELVLVAEHRQQQAERAMKQKEAQRLKQQCNYDRMERKHMKADQTQSRDLKFGTKQTTWKDIGVELCDKKKGKG